MSTQTHQNAHNMITSSIHDQLTAMLTTTDGIVPTLLFKQSSVFIESVDNTISAECIIRYLYYEYNNKNPYNTVTLTEYLQLANFVRDMYLDASITTNKDSQLEYTICYFNTHAYDASKISKWFIIFLLPNNGLLYVSISSIDSYSDKDVLFKTKYNTIYNEEYMVVSHEYSFDMNIHGKSDNYKSIALKNSLIYTKIPIENPLKIHFVGKELEQYYITSVNVEYKTPIENISVIYGDGIEDYTDNLIKYLTTKGNNGIHILHGPPGTGKTHYLRHIIYEICDDVDMLYLTGSTIEKLIDDSSLFMCISKWCMEHLGAVIIIEDGEPLIQSRSDTRTTQIANLLNMADGLLGDVLQVQFIITYNIENKNVDSAIIRPGRIKFDKYFGTYSKGRAKEVIDLLGSTIEPSDELSLATIYAHTPENSIINITHQKHGYDFIDQTKLDIELI